MRNFRFDCANCKSENLLPLKEASSQTNCHKCGKEIIVDVFPALTHPTGLGDKGEPLASDDESSCFYHPSKKAATPCSGCGRFLCSLCEIEFNGARLCAACIEKGLENGELAGAKNEYIYYDQIAFSLAIFSLLIWPVTLITAPLIIYMVIRYWRTQLSEAPRGRWRFVAAMVMAASALVGWISWVAILIL